MSSTKHRWAALCRDAGVYLLIRTTLAFLGIFPIRVYRGLAETLAVVFTDVFPVRRRVLDENLSLAFPDASPRERRQIIRKMWEHLFRMGAEFILGRRVMHETNWRRFVEIEDGPQAVRLFFAKRPLIMVTGHFGNFEMGGYILGLFGYPTFSVARKLDNPFLDRYISRLRGATGQYLLDKNTGYDDILKVLRENGIVAFLVDQSAGPKGCRVDFFGRVASAYKAMALLSLEYDAPILVCHAVRVEHAEMRFRLEPVDFFDPRRPPDGIESVFEITQWFTSRLEESIRQRPNQYWWLHRRWKDYGHPIPIERIRSKIRHVGPIEPIRRQNVLPPDERGSGQKTRDPRAASPDWERRNAIDGKHAGG